MNCHSILKKWETILLITILCVMHVIHPFTHVATADASSTYAFIVLSSYQRTMKIGQSFYLIGVASNGKTVKWKSSNTKTASVNTYGQVTAKKAGTCKITAKITGAEASCSVTVQKTEITLNYSNLTMENGSSITLHATTSNGAAVTWKSSKTSVVTIDDNGYLEAQKPGSATITASADGSKQTCKITVKTPKVTLGASSIRLYRNQTYKLDVKVSSGRTPAFSSQKGSVASVNEKGIITAYKHGTARIYVKIDGITRTCVVTVVSPEITLTPASATLKKGKTLTLKTVVSSGCTPVYSSSKPSVATVDARGKITAVSKGTCIIYASEDGTKASCKITVSES